MDLFEFEPSGSTSWSDNVPDPLLSADTLPDFNYDLGASEGKQDGKGNYGKEVTAAYRLRTSVDRATIEPSFAVTLTVPDLRRTVRTWTVPVAVPSASTVRRTWPGTSTFCRLVDWSLTAATPGALPELVTAIRRVNLLPAVAVVRAGVRRRLEKRAVCPSTESIQARPVEIRAKTPGWYGLVQGGSLLTKLVTPASTFAPAGSATSGPPLSPKQTAGLPTP